MYNLEWGNEEEHATVYADNDERSGSDHDATVAEAVKEADANERCASDHDANTVEAVANLSSETDEGLSQEDTESFLACMNKGI
jgi:hypothetical protein